MSFPLISDLSIMRTSFHLTIAISTADLTKSRILRLYWKSDRSIDRFIFGTDECNAPPQDYSLERKDPLGPSDRTTFAQRLQIGDTPGMMNSDWMSPDGRCTCGPKPHRRYQGSSLARCCLSPTPVTTITGEPSDVSVTDSLIPLQGADRTTLMLQTGAYGGGGGNFKE